MKLVSVVGLVLLCVVTPVYAITCADVSCDEARNYPQMDRDKDGYYCEAQCGSYTPNTKSKTEPMQPKKMEETKKTTTPKAVTPKQPETKVSSKKSSKYINGPKGGCYYLNTKKKKVYVDKKYCN